MAADNDITRVLARNRLATNRLVQQAGATATRKLLLDSQRDLENRLSRSLQSTGPKSFTSTQLRSSLVQVREVLRTITIPSLKDTVVKHGVVAAHLAVHQTVDYLHTANKAFTGVVAGLPIREASVFEHAVSGARSSILRHISSGGRGTEKARNGVLERYNDATITHFEKTFQRGLITGKSQAQMRDEIIEGSPFLQQAPAHYATRIVRTECHYSANVATHEAMKEVNVQLGGGMIRILCATFDDRTGSDSIAVHGQVRHMDEPFGTWYGDFMTPPDRPNDREIVVPHRLRWSIPDSLRPKDEGEILDRWKQEGRKGSPPARPQMSTVDEIKY